MQFFKKLFHPKVLVSSLAFGLVFVAAPVLMQRSILEGNAPQFTGGQNVNPDILLGAQALLNSKDFYLSQSSVYYGPTGTKVVLTGSGFATSSTVNFGSKKIAVTATNSRSITFKVPDVTSGRYEITVTSGKKKSEPLPFMVTDRGAPLPVIEKIEPATAYFGEEIKITGRNFSKTGNIVSTGLGAVRDVKSPDGKTLVFKIPFPDYLKNNIPQVRKVWFGDKDNLYWNVVAFVVNTNGISEFTPAAKFIMNIK